MPTDRNDPGPVQLVGRDYVVRPRRGGIDLDWCRGCPMRIDVTLNDAGETVVVCEPGTTGHRGFSGPLRDLPEIWKTA